MNQTTPPNKPCVLVVDDEINVLKSIRRTLHKLDIELILVDTPEKALNILSKKNIDVVLSDMKMPTINGAELLATVAKQQPNSFRIILSGYADVDSMLAAINQGKVHRYLNKPWSNDELVDVIKDGIELSQLRYDNSRLLAQIQNQNRELETKVSLRTRQIKAALTKIQKHSGGLERALYNVIVSHPNIDGKFARQVSKSALQLSKAVGLNEKEQKIVRLAALICQIGLIGISDSLITNSYSALNFEQKQAFKNQANIARMILSPLQSLEEEIEIIACQFDKINGDIEPPKGAKIVSICRDYWRYRMGIIQNEQMTVQATHTEMLKHAGVKYDKSMLLAFSEIEHHTVDQNSEGGVATGDLAPGMQLKNDMYNDLHILILPEGHIFTEVSINKLKKFEQGNGSKMLHDVDLG